MTLNKTTLLALSVIAALLYGCSSPKSTKAVLSKSAHVDSAIHKMSASDKANLLFDTIYMERVYRRPTTQTSLGMKTDYDKWNDISEENYAKELQFARNNLVRIQSIDVAQLDAQTQLSYKLFEQSQAQIIADYQWRHHDYPVNQMYGTHTKIPSLLINRHSIDNLKEAKDYIARLNGARTLLAQLVEQLKLREDKGIIAPKFVYDHVIRSSQNILKGAPFDAGEASVLFNDFKSKIAKLAVPDEKKAQLIVAAEAALLKSIKPGYEELIAYVNKLQNKANDDVGAWQFPDGEKFYNNALKRMTTTELTADEIHQIGLLEVNRIHDEMRSIMKLVNFKGELGEFFDFMRHAPQFYYSNTDAGRQQYLDDVSELVSSMQEKLAELFTIQPKAALKVKRVAAFREQSASKAFYQGPTPDGTRPGTYYVNLYNMEAMPIYQMPALAYHEALPGHHMQIGLQVELNSIPKFRKFGGYTAYTEGWALYSELLPKEIGFYQDPYADFGRLAMELWRACRLVVDTGIHQKMWSREQAMQYYMHNTPNPKSDVVKMVERHIVDPAQATSYKIGMMKILELRDYAKLTLGNQFDISAFHDIILKNGPVPLSVLEENVRAYAQSAMQ